MRECLNVSEYGEPRFKNWLERRICRSRFNEAKLTFNQLAKWYLEERKKTKAFKAYRRIKIAINNFNKKFGNTRVADITPVKIENFQHERNEAGKAKATIDLEVGSVRAMINVAFKERMVPGYAVLAFKEADNLLSGDENARDRYLEWQEYEKLIGVAKDHLKPVLMVAYQTAMRKSEILKLTWDRVDLENRFIILKRGDTKTKQPRIVPIFDKILPVFEELYDQQSQPNLGRVFNYQNQALRDISSSFVTACKDAGIKYGKLVEDGFIFHDLRGTCITNWRRKGIPDHIIMLMSGHKSNRMLQRYDRSDERDVLYARRVMDDEIGEVSPRVVHVPQLVFGNR